MPTLSGSRRVLADGVSIEAKAHTNGQGMADEDMKRGPRLRREPDMEKLVALFTTTAAVIGTALSALLTAT
jgi:hypothetical protein